MAYRPILLSFVSFLTVGSALAQTAPPPASIRTKMQVMDTACGAAGGRPGGGAYIVNLDFTGDGVKDYLVSEGTYNCTGKPDAFKPGGRAVVELYVMQGADAPRGYSETVKGFRVIPGTPAQLQVVRDAGTVTLRYDAPSRRFLAAGEAPPPAAVDPLAGVGARPAQQAAAPPPAATVAPAPAASTPETQATFQARCVRERRAKYRELTQAIADSSCRSIWDLAQAAMPAANAIAAVGGGAPGPMAQAAVRSAIPGATWGGKVGPGTPAAGRLGQWEVALKGQTLIDNVQFNWAKVGTPIPYDVAEALRIKGARVTEVACQNLGGGEATHVYRVEAAGRPAFGLSIYRREAPTAGANSTYNVTADLKGPVPTLAALKRTPDGADMTATCD